MKNAQRWMDVASDAIGAIGNLMSTYMSAILTILRRNRRQMRKRTMLMLKGLKHLPKVEQYLRRKQRFVKELLKLKHQERMRNLRKRSSVAAEAG